MQRQPGDVLTRSMSMSGEQEEYPSDQEEKDILKEFSETRAQIREKEKRSREEFERTMARINAEKEAKAKAALAAEEAEAAKKVTIAEVTHGADADGDWPLTDDERMRLEKLKSDEQRQVVAGVTQDVNANGDGTEAKSKEEQQLKVRQQLEQQIDGTLETLAEAEESFFGWEGFPPVAPANTEAAKYQLLLKAIKDAQALLKEELDRLMEKGKKTAIHKNTLKASEDAFRALYNGLDDLSSKLKKMKQEGKNDSEINEHGKKKIEGMFKTNFDQNALFDINKHTLPIFTWILRKLANLFIRIPGLGHLISYACENRIRYSHAGEASQSLFGATLFGNSTHRAAVAGQVQRMFDSNMIASRASLCVNISEVGRAYRKRPQESAPSFRSPRLGPSAGGQ